VFAGVFMLSSQLSKISRPTHKSPEVSSPAAATGTDTGVCKNYWHHDFILPNPDKPERIARHQDTNNKCLL
jgi:hypothetical protein